MQEHVQRGGRLREFAQGKRGKISGNVIENNLGSAAEYSMIITDRKKAKDSDDPEGGIHRVCNKSSRSQDRGLCQKMGDKDEYGKIEECRAKTRITDMESQMLCFCHSRVLYNEWVIVRAMLSDGTERQSHDHADV